MKADFKQNSSSKLWYLLDLSSLTLNLIFNVKKFPCIDCEYISIKEEFLQ